MAKQLTNLLLLFIFSSQAFANMSFRILNGMPVDKNDSIYWSTVRIIERNSDSLWVPACTAVIYSRNIILTAGHCLEGKKIDNLRIAYDAQPFSIEQQYLPGSAIDPLLVFKTGWIYNFEIHPAYFSVNKKDYDIAVIRTEMFHPDKYRSFPMLTPEIAKKVLPNKSYTFSIAGYGLLAASPPAESEVLRKSRVLGVVKDNFILVDQRMSSGGCFGDSGGPALLQIDSKSYVAGIAHGGIGASPNCDQMGGWTYIPNMLTYIMSAINRLNSK